MLEIRDNVSLAPLIRLPSARGGAGGAGVVMLEIRDNVSLAPLILDRWTSYRHNALGQASAYLTPHPLYLAIGREDTERQAAYRDLFQAQLDNKAIDDIRLALNQNQPLGNSRFYAKIEATTGQRKG
jgi:putative transposase